MGRRCAGLCSRVVDDADQPLLATLAQQLLWGGDGTLMEVDGDTYLNRWTPYLRGDPTAFL